MKIYKYILTVTLIILASCGDDKSKNRRMTYLVDSVTPSTYYISLAGNGNNSGKATNATWDLAKLNSNFGAINPGDSILFKRGETFSGQLTVGKSGTSSQPIVISSYGATTIDKPIISAMAAISNWTPVSGSTNVYESDAVSGGLTTLNVVTVNGVITGMGRYPNADAANGGYKTMDAGSTSTVIKDTGLATSPDWAGADAVVRSRRFILDRRHISNHDNNNHSLTITSATYAPLTGYGYFITNSPLTLDQDGEWYWNPSTKKLKMYWSDGEPQNIKVSVRNNCIVSDQKSYIKFVNLATEGANLEGMAITYGTKNSVTGCRINNSGLSGYYGYNSTATTFQYDTVTNSLTRGIDAAYGASNINISYNYVRNSYHIAGMGASGNSQGAGINLRGKGSVCRYNQVINSGFSGIYYSAIDSVDVSYNYVDTFGFVKDDCGGLHTWTGGSAKVINKARFIKGNIVRNGIGAPLGTSNLRLTTSGALNPFYISSFGAYFDLNASNAVLEGNYFDNPGRGCVFLNYLTNDVQVLRNTFYNSPFYDIYIVRDDTRDVYNHKIYGNIFFLNNQFKHIKTDNFSNSVNPTIGKIDTNYYVNYNTSTLKPWGLRNNSYNFSEWKAATVFDDNSTQRLFSTSDVIKAVYTTSSSLEVDLDTHQWTDGKGVIWSAASKPLTLSPYNSAVLIRGIDNGGGGCVGSCPTISIATDFTSYTAPATIKLTATVSDADGTITKVQFYVGANSLYTDNAAPWAANWSNVPKGTYTFKAKVTDSDGNVVTSSTLTRTVN